MERCRVDASSRCERLAAFSDDGVRTARGVVATKGCGRKPLAYVSRTSRRADSLREAAGLHAHRVDADHGTSIRRIVGISDGWLFRGDAAIRLAGGFLVFLGLLPSRSNCVSF